MWDYNENQDLDTSVSYNKDNLFQVNFALHLDEAIHILYKPLPLSI